MRGLGYIWTFPESPNDDTGLGGGITYALDPKLCDDMLPRFMEDIWFIPFLNCGDLEDAFTRGLEAWSKNHPLISFVDVSEECKQQDVTPCPLAEVWVTASDELSASAVASALSGVRYSSTFRYTNGHRPIVTRSDGSTGQAVVVETYGATVSFSKSECWYLDSQFCSGFHDLKDHASPNTVRTVGLTLLFLIWGIALLGNIIQLALTFRAIRRAAAMDKAFQGCCDGTIWRAYLRSLSTWSVFGTSLRLVLLIVPWTFYRAIFVTCWDCFDFEGAVVHEWGHVLGLSHPDLLTSETNTNYPPTGENLGTVAYEPAACADPWQSVFIRPTDAENVSVMLGFTQHNPRVCLSEDDQQALWAIYPLCNASFPELYCDDTRLRIGAVRIFIYILIPFLLGVVFALVLHWRAAESGLPLNWCHCTCIDYVLGVRDKLPQGKAGKRQAVSKSGSNTQAVVRS